MAVGQIGRERKGRRPNSEETHDRFPRTCLIVEDSAITARFYAGLVQEGGLEVAVAESADITLKWIEEGRRFDLVLLDLLLPGVNGYELLERMRAADENATILVISGKVDAAAPTESFYRGADGFASKRELHRCDWQSLREVIELAHAHRVRTRQQEGARRELEAGRRLLEGIFEYAPEGLVIADAPDVRIRNVTQYASDLLGRPLSELIDLPASEHVECWGIWNPDGKTRPDPDALPLTRAVKRGERVVNEEFLLENGDGEKVPVLVSAGPILAADGKVIAGICAWRESSGIHRMRESLERLVRERTHDLLDAKRRLERLDVLKSKFLANVSHEFRTPLNVILGFTELLLEPAHGLLGDEHRLQLRTVLEAGQVMHRLVEDLLQLTWLDSGTEAGDLDWFVPADVIERVVALFERRMEASGVTLLLRGLDNGTRLWGSAQLFEQLMYHLVDNAVKFTPQGHVEVALRSSPGGLLITVLDTGVGMSPVEVRRLFAPFEQDNDLSPGLGLGLYLCQRISERFEGRLSIDSALGVGTVASLFVPFRQPTA